MSKKIHIVFVNFHYFEGNSGLHIHPLANELCLLGYQVTILTPGNKTTISTLDDKALYHMQCYSSEEKIDSSNGVVFIAWTPREIVRKKTLALTNEYNAPYFVHLEDNEEQIIRDNLGSHFNNLNDGDIDYFDKITPENISHPIRYKDFLKGSKGITCIIETLKDFIPHNIPSFTFWPSCEKDFFLMPNEIEKKRKNEYNIPEEQVVIFYSGNMHLSNVSEVTTLYEAIYLLNKQGEKVTLLRTGKNYTDFSKSVDLSQPYYIELGDQPLRNNINYISISDILVQPGIDNEFNHYRFPSKLPMFLASGKPVVLSDTNLGLFLTDWENCLKFVENDAEELAHKISLLIRNKLLARHIGNNGRLFAEKNFSWQKSALGFCDFIEKTISNETVYRNSYTE